METYKMECPYCYNTMIYIKNKKQEELGHICMKCQGCEDLFLVPKGNPRLEVINE